MKLGPDTLNFFRNILAWKWSPIAPSEYMYRPDIGRKLNIYEKVAKDVLDVFWTSDVRLVYIMRPGVKLFIFKVTHNLLHTLDETDQISGW